MKINADESDRFWVNALSSTAAVFNRAARVSTRLPGPQSLKTDVDSAAHALRSRFSSETPDCEGVCLHERAFIRDPQVSGNSEDRPFILDDTKDLGGHRIHDPINWPRLRQLIDECTPASHEHCGPVQETTTRLPLDFRVLDVEEERLVKLPTGKQHVALSYVWGAPESAGPTTVLANVGAYENKVPTDSLPRTLRDAMKACRHLGQRYLWIDRLCIVQDDARSKMEQIAAMGRIYRSAALVIIASAGQDANSPLPGVSCCRPKDTAIQFLLKGQDRSTVWWERGWTYQEAVLARRKLYFTAHQVLFECDTVAKREKTRGRNWAKLRDPGDADGAWLKTMRLHKTTDGVLDPDIVAYVEQVKEYNHRTLSFPADIFDAFAGIASELFGSKGGCHFNLPRAHFVQALLWIVEPGDSVKVREVPDMRLPTWSWVSVMGHIHWHPALASFTAPLVVWSQASHALDHGQRAPELLPRLIEASGEPVSWTKWSKSQKSHSKRRREGSSARSLLALHGYILFLAIREGLFEPVYDTSELSSKSFHLLQQPSIPTMLREMSRRFPTYSAFHRALMLSYRFRDIFLPEPFLRPDIIATEAQVARFTFVSYDRECPPDLTERTGTVTLAVCDQQGARCGRVQAFAHSMPPDIFSAGCWLVGLALAVGEEDTMVLPVARDDVYFRDEGWRTLPPKAPPIVHVMMVEWRGVLARRLGMGWVYMKQWVKAKRQITVVALE
jgi:hypothetical protein